MPSSKCSFPAPSRYFSGGDFPQCGVSVQMGPNLSARSGYAAGFSRSIRKSNYDAVQASLSRQSFSATATSRASALGSLTRHSS